MMWELFGLCDQLAVQCLCYLLYLLGLVKEENKLDSMASWIGGLINLFRTLNILFKNLSDKRRKKWCKL